MRHLLTAVFMAGFFLLADERESAAAPIELLADLEVRIGSENTVLCEQSLVNAVVNPAASLACSTGSMLPGAFIQAFANPNGSISIGGQLSVPDSDAIDVFASVTMKGDQIHVQHNTLTSGWLQIAGHPSGAITFSTLDCGIGCTASAEIDGEVTLGPFEHELVTGRYLGPVPGLKVVVPEVSGAFFVPFTVGVQIPIEYSFEARAGLIGAAWPPGASLFGAISLADPPLITILDDDLQPVLDAQLVSAAGINYGAGATQPVPEPGMLLLFAAGIAGATRRRAHSRPIIRSKGRRAAE